MTTGDLKNNLRKFHAELKLISYVNDMDIEGLSIGRPSAFLPILHFVLTEFSIELAQYFYSKEYELLGKNDKNFVSVIYRILRDEFNSKPPLTKEQFFTLGFAERKLQFVSSLIQLCRKKSDTLKPKKKKKNVLGSNTAKTSKMDIRIPGRAGSITIATKVSEETSVVTMPTKTPLAAHFPKPCIQQELDNVVSSQITQKQSLNSDLNLTMPNDGQSDVPRSSYKAPFFSQNVASSSSQSGLKTSAGIKTTLQGRPSDEASKYEHATKENICPNLGNDLTDEAYNNAQSFVNGNVVNRLHPEQSTMLSPIPVTNRMNIESRNSQSEMQFRNPSNMPFVNFSESPECSKHIFITQTSEGVECPLRNESLDMSLLDEHSQEVTEILEHVKKQDKRIDALEKEVEERNCRIDELVETNSKLNARVMVLETAVALIQEKLEP